MKKKELALTTFDTENEFYWRTKRWRPRTRCLPKIRRDQHGLPIKTEECLMSDPNVRKGVGVYYAFFNVIRRAAKKLNLSKNYQKRKESARVLKIKLKGLTRLFHD